MQNLFFLCLTIITCLSVFDSNNFIAQAVTSWSEIATLKAFKSSINPSSIKPGSCLASWNFTIDPCSFPRRTYFTCGLTCTPDSTHINQITLDPVGYTGTLTPLISKLTNLITLDLSENSFFGPIPSSLYSLPNLQTLTLRSNSFSGSIPPTIKSLISLQSLDLSHNSLSGSLPISLNYLSNLRRIDLSFNKLNGSIPELPPNLSELAIKANSLSGPLQKSTFQKANKLAVLELSENSLYGKLEPWLFQLPSLQQVDLANNRFNGIEIWKPANGRSSDLVAIDLGFNTIQGYAPANLSAYPTLSSLSIRYNLLRGTIPLEYGESKTLKRLFLDGNFLTGKPPAGLLVSGNIFSGSLGNNCLVGCPASSQLCKPAQKPSSVCKKAYNGKPST
ncbi:hypothetical protein TanjilG_18366 [Lupinus angustifolius]|uniref:Leucine-rich repeat-containing N-terminal plant-type domain-containing protein n=1 Tax=Lupinus angustifolius TaxID=3871 RepID=A0A1J7HKM3_LUPAN|nr:PREDICTED: receptor-like protein kinase 5 [Lupinus angustifolius]OIW06978.1 hypothetical protein TanjilG_18366 [Lupinus angustifolius]